MLTQSIIWLEYLEPEHKNATFSKALLLAKLKKAGFPIAPGFVITDAFYQDFLTSSGLNPKIATILASLNSEDPQDLLERSQAIQKLIMTAPITDDLSNQLLTAYQDLMSFHGHTTFDKLIPRDYPLELLSPHGTVDVPAGDSNLTAAVRDYWATLFSPVHLKNLLARPGSLLVRKKMSPDTVITFSSFDPSLGHKSGLVIRPEESRDSKLTSQLLPVFKELEQHNYFPLVVEFSVEGDEAFITKISELTLTALPVTHHEEQQNAAPKSKTKFIGLAASPGIKTGTSKIITDPNIESKKINFGDILVIRKTDKHSLSLMRKVSAIVVEEPSYHSHAASFARIRGIPCVCGIPNLTSLLQDKTTLTVNGLTGEVIFT